MVFNHKLTLKFTTMSYIFKSSSEHSVLDIDIWMTEFLYLNITSVEKL